MTNITADLDRDSIVFLDSPHFGEGEAWTIEGFDSVDDLNAMRSDYLKAARMAMEQGHAHAAAMYRRQLRRDMQTVRAYRDVDAFIAARDLGFHLTAERTLRVIGGTFDRNPEDL